MERLKYLRKNQFNRSQKVISKGTVKSISNNICHVVLEDQGEDVWECSVGSIIENKSNHLSVYPKIGSIVLLGLMNDGTGVILSVSEVDKIYFRNEKTEFTFDSSGFQFNRDGENLKEVLNTFQEGFGRLCDELSKVVVSIGVSPDVPAIQQIKDDIVNKNREALNKILT